MDAAVFTQDDTAWFDSGGGAISISSYGTAAIALLDAGTTGAVSVTSTDGAITDNTSAETANIIGASAALSAETGIGASDDIETTVTTISADTTNGNIDIHNTHALDVTVTSLTTGDGDIWFSQDGGGNLTVNTATTTDGTIWIDVIDGADLIATGGPIAAGGTYYLKDPLNDDRASINFLDEPMKAKDPGDPIDVAVYLLSTEGNVTLNSTSVTIAANGAMVIDAYDTVTFGDTFENSSSSIDVLEACSRISETLNDAYILKTLPYADEFGGCDNPPWAWFDGEYVLRGGMPDAWVLKWIDPVPLPLPMIFEPERKDDPNDVEPEENGIPADLEDAYLHSTDILALSNIMAMPLQYAAAGQRSDASVGYVSTPNTELDWWTDRHTASKIGK